MLRAPRVAAGIALIGWAALLLQLVLTLKLTRANGDSIAWGLVIYFGFFTILTNLLVSVTLTVPLLAPRSAAGRFFGSPRVLAGVAVSIALVGITYHLLLRNIWNPQGAQLLADRLLHYVVPGVFVIYWLLFVPRDSLRWRDALWWALYPLGYLAYALVRGALTGLYAYPFIDVTALGYPRTLLNALGLTCAFFLLCVPFVAAGRLQRRLR